MKRPVSAIREGCLIRGPQGSLVTVVSMQPARSELFGSVFRITLSDGQVINRTPSARIDVLQYPKRIRRKEE